MKRSRQEETISKDAKKQRVSGSSPATNTRSKSPGKPLYQLTDAVSAQIVTRKPKTKTPQRKTPQGKSKPSVPCVVKEDFATPKQATPKTKAVALSRKRTVTATPVREASASPRRPSLLKNIPVSKRQVKDVHWALLFAYSFVWLYSYADSITAATRDTNAFFSIAMLVDAVQTGAVALVLLVFCSWFAWTVFCIGAVAVGIFLYMLGQSFFPDVYLGLALVLLYGAVVKTLWKHMYFACILLEESSKCLVQNLHIIPIALLLKSIGQHYLSFAYTNATSDSVDVKRFLFIVFQSVWVVQFLGYLADFVTARTMASWYLDRHSYPRRVGDSCRALLHAVQFQAGSIAAFSLVHSVSYLLKKGVQRLHQCMRTSTLYRFVGIIRRVLDWMLYVVEHINDYALLYASLGMLGYYDASMKAIETTATHPVRILVAKYYSMAVMVLGVLTMDVLTIGLRSAVHSETLYTILHDRSFLVSATMTYYYLFRILSIGMRTLLVVTMDAEDTHKDRIQTQVTKALALFQ